jgi:hypothetical protein
MGIRGTRNFLDEDGIPFPKAVTFVGREEERKLLGRNPDSVAEGEFAVVTQFFSVWEDKFPEAEEGMETG